MRKRKVVIILVAIISIASLVGFQGAGDKYFDIAKSLDIFATLFKEVNAHYVDEIDPNKLITVGINGMLESLDPYTDYIPEESADAFSILTTGQYAGIGALIGILNGKAVITEPYAGFPAYRAGLRVGDEFVSVNGTNVVGKSTAEISALLKGKPKTDVEIVVKRAGQKENLSYKLVRENIKINNVVYQGLVGDDIGYIKLDDFTPGASNEVAEAVTKLVKDGAKGVILDLRDNPGGLLYEAVNIVNVFIPKGMEVVSTKGKIKDWNKTYVTLNAPVDPEIPVAVLTSGGSASASEIVAGALQDYDRAVLVGQKTFGKGLVQTTRQLSYNAQVKITTAKYYIPSGRCIQALDYTHRNRDGSVDKIADSLKTEFKTKGGRSVFDGGGLDPDIKVEHDAPSAVLEELITSGLAFEYATVYCAAHEAPASMKTFKLSDEDYDQFLSWLKGKKFEYRSDLEQQVQDLIEVAKEERTYQELKDHLQAIEKQVEDFRGSDMMRFKKEIVQALQQEIAFHYALDPGQVEVSFRDDKEVIEAQRVLREKVVYQQLLSAKK